MFIFVELSTTFLQHYHWSIHGLPLHNLKVMEVPILPHGWNKTSFQQKMAARAWVHLAQDSRLKTG